MAPPYDVIVLGLGGMAAATAHPIELFHTRRPAAAAAA